MTNTRKPYMTMCQDSLCFNIQQFKPLTFVNVIHEANRDMDKFYLLRRKEKL